MPRAKEKIRDLVNILKIKKRISIDQLKSILNLSDEIFNENIFDWADQLGFIIDGDYIEVNEDNVNSFIKALDIQFMRWEQNIASGSSKFEDIKKVERFSKLTSFQGVRIPEIEANTLYELEILTGKPFNIDNIKRDDISKGFLYVNGVQNCFSIENNRVKSIILQNFISYFNEEFLKSIGQLSSLKELYLINILMNNLPESVGELKLLQTLFFSNNQTERSGSLETLPESIENLISLKELYLIGTLLKTLPKSISKLESLQNLSIFNMNGGLYSLSNSIGNLHSIQKLYLAYNQLTFLPESISNLKLLRWLYLNNNNLTALPESIGNLESLQCLDLQKCELTTLPDSIGDLNSLQELRLNDNKLMNLPESIGNISSLQILDLSGNQFKILPASLGQLYSLKTLYLDKNNSIINSEIIKKLEKNGVVIIRK